MVSQHLGKCLAEEQRVRWVSFLMQSALEAGLPNDPDFRAALGAYIINISSGAACLAMPEIIAYGATKGALDTFTLNLAKELGPRGITANSVAPGIVDTDVNAAWLRGNQCRAVSHSPWAGAPRRGGAPGCVH
jgi:NAD(P)-dependent dehydrogenase (short-subunit alcohol dehydrogenase family)